MEATKTNYALTQRFCRLGRAHTKVIATIGPATENRLDELIQAGMDVARLNFSHGTPEDHRRRTTDIREAALRCNTPVAILADIRGPKMRLGTMPGGWKELEVGERMRLVEGDAVDTEDEIPFNVSGFSKALKNGDRVFLADGAVEMIVEEISGASHMARVRRGGRIGDRKGFHLPDADLKLKVPTDVDIVDLALAHEIGVDFVGVSFVSTAAELHEVRRLVPDAQIVAKIERAAALENLDEILEATDGIMVARGDLGVEVELEQLPMVQKSLLAASLKAGKFTITATEMLESMVDNSRPTRAEVADVANAVLDGTDCVMLSAETAVGKNALEAVETMDRIAGAVEASQRYLELPRVAFRSAEPTTSNAVALAAADAAKSLGISKIVCFTESGNTPRQLSRYRTSAEIIALSPHVTTLRRMTVLAHVRPIKFPQEDSLEAMLDGACRLLLERQIVARGENVIFVAGVPPGVARSTNLMKLHRIGDPIRLA
ncbi:MAG: pyruvate kinase [Planctomycetota bacterium]|jgi:pyruvate kinase